LNLNTWVICNNFCPSRNPEHIQCTNKFWITESLDYWIHQMGKNIGRKSQVTKKICEKIMDIHKKYWITRSPYYWIQACTWCVTGKTIYQAASKTQKVTKNTWIISLCLKPTPLWSPVLSLSYAWNDELKKGHAHMNLPPVKSE